DPEVSINDSGTVVFAATDTSSVKAIWKADSGGTSRLPGPAMASGYLFYTPQINNKGEVIYEVDAPGSPLHFYSIRSSFQGAETTHFTAEQGDRVILPSISDSDTVVFWESFGTGGIREALITLGRATPLFLGATDGAVRAMAANGGKVVWKADDGIKL